MWYVWAEGVSLDRCKSRHRS